MPPGRILLTIRKCRLTIGKEEKRRVRGFGETRRDGEGNPRGEKRDQDSFRVLKVETNVCSAKSSSALVRVSSSSRDTGSIGDGGVQRIRVTRWIYARTNGFMEMETLFGGRGITRFTQRTEETVIRVCTLGQKVGCVVWWLCSLSLVLMQAKKKNPTRNTRRSRERAA